MRVKVKKLEPDVFVARGVHRAVGLKLVAASRRREPLAGPIASSRKVPSGCKIAPTKANVLDSKILILTGPAAAVPAGPMSWALSEQIPIGGFV